MGTNRIGETNIFSSTGRRIMIPKWKQRGNCVGEPPYLFYSSNLNLVERAREICQNCPVQIECLEYGIRYDEYGVWGGKTESERAFLKRAALVQGLPLIDLLRRNKRVQERLASESRTSPSYTPSQQMNIRELSGKVVVSQDSSSDKVYIMYVAPL
jgi:WhiB family redox-sensing transcriptional regulator